MNLAVDTLGHLLALLVTPANEQDQEQVEALAAAVLDATGDSVEVAYVDQGYTGEDAAQAAEGWGIRLEVVERTQGWAARFRRLARDYERLPETLAGLHLLAFVSLMVQKVVSFLVDSS